MGLSITKIITKLVIYDEEKRWKVTVFIKGVEEKVT